VIVYFDSDRILLNSNGNHRQSPHTLLGLCSTFYGHTGFYDNTYFHLGRHHSIDGHVPATTRSTDMYPPPLDRRTCTRHHNLLDTVHRGSADYCSTRHPQVASGRASKVGLFRSANYNFITSLGPISGRLWVPRLNQCLRIDHHL
jgi:hypothetical protein